MAMPSIMKPEKKVFVYYRFLIFLIVSLLVMSAVLVASLVIGVFLQGLLAVPVFILSNLIYFAYRSVRFKKEEYELQDKRLIIRKGGFFTEHETELVVRNITQVWLNLPFIETRLFKTGNLKIKAAGSSQVEIYLSSIRHPRKAYSRVEKLMVDNGFVLTRKKRIMREKPSLAGVILENLSMLVSLGFFALFLPLASIIAAVQEAGTVLLVALLGILVFLIVLAVLVLRVINNMRRVYYLYEDLLEYYDGFMTRNYSLIPIENLSDTETTQSFFEKILDIHDVKLSSQGSGNEIHFKNMPNGRKLKHELDKLIEKTESLLTSSSEPAKSAGKKDKSSHKNEKASVHIKTSKKLSGDSFTKELRMEAKRALLPTLVTTVLAFFLIEIGILVASLLPGVEPPMAATGAFLIAPMAFLILFGILAFEAAGIMIMVMFTKFKINRSSIERDFSFLTAKNTEYSIDKITLMQTSESIIDKLFGTFNIHFSTIGGGESIVFKHIKKDEKLESSLRKKLGLSGSKRVEEYKPSFSFWNMCMKNIYIIIFTDLLAITSLVLGLVINGWFLAYIPAYLVAFALLYVYQDIFYRRARLHLFKDHVMFSRGIIIEKHDYALFCNIKDLVTIRYPFSDKGTAKFNVAGEMAITDGKGNQTVMSNSFSVNYLAEVGELHEKIDHILLNNPMKGKRSRITSKKMDEVVKSVKPSPANPTTVLVLVSVLFLPLVVLLPITIPFVRLYVRRKTFIIQPYRVCSDVGVFFRTRTTVLFNRFDHLSVRQGLLNKVYKNGNVIVFTAGSSQPELSLGNIPGHRDFYNTLESEYKG